jgi:hypothetical protein
MQLHVDDYKSVLDRWIDAGFECCREIICAYTECNPAAKNLVAATDQSMDRLQERIKGTVHAATSKRELMGDPNDIKAKNRIVQLAMLGLIREIFGHASEEEKRLISRTSMKEVTSKQEFSDIRTVRHFLDHLKQAAETIKSNLCNLETPSDPQTLVRLISAKQPVPAA